MRERLAVLILSNFYFQVIVYSYFIFCVFGIHPADLIYFWIYYFFFLDAEGDNILVETTLYPYVSDSEATKDLVAIIEMNKRKCLAGEPIPLCVMDLSQTNSPPVISLRDSTVNTIFNKSYTSESSHIIMVILLFIIRGLNQWPYLDFLDNTRQTLANSIGTCYLF